MLYMTWPPVDCIIDNYIRRAQCCLARFTWHKFLCSSGRSSVQEHGRADRGFLRRAQLNRRRLLIAQSSFIAARLVTRA